MQKGFQLSWTQVNTFASFKGEMSRWQNKDIFAYLSLSATTHTILWAVLLNAQLLMQNDKCGSAQI